MIPKGNVLPIFLSILLQTIFRQTNGQSIADLDIQIKLIEGYPLDSLLNFTGMAEAHGYTAEQHTVVTQDGYILTIFRIPRGKNCKGPTRRPPVLLMHGLQMSSDSWLDSGPNAGLGYLIADACYDLWAGNVRGNYYGKAHVKYNPNTDIKFWEFSVNEIGTYDMPATIAYILNYTESDSLNYIGYSQGGGTFFIMCSQTQGNCDKVNVFIGLEPASRFTYTKSLFFRLLMEVYQDLGPFLVDLGFYQALPWGGFVQKFAAFFCRDFFIADTLCRAALAIIDSPHPFSIETETIRVLFGHFPAGTSIKNMQWYSQALNADDFQNFDYGTTGNMELYGSPKPPVYNLNATTTPTVIINGRNDFITAPADIEWLTDNLPNVLEHYIVVNPLSNHLDIPYSKLTSKYLFPKINEYLTRFSEEVTTSTPDQ